MKYFFIFFLIIFFNNVFSQDERYYESVNYPIPFIHGYGQSNCRYPFDQSADSLINFVIKESGSEGVFRNAWGFRNDYKDPNHNTAFSDCIDDLKSRIGDSLLCTNVEMNSMYSFDKRTSFTNVFTLTFLYQVPVINEPIEVTYVYNSNIEGKSRVLEYPHNLPTLLINEIHITRERAIELLKSENILKDDNYFNLRVEGNYWRAFISQDNSLIIIEVGIHIGTGELTDLVYLDTVDY